MYAYVCVCVYSYGSTKRTHTRQALCVCVARFLITVCRWSGAITGNCQRITQQRQYLCRPPPTEGGGVTGAK